MKTLCWKCLTPFYPSKESVTAWAESNRPFDPTDWECTSCEQHPAAPAPGTRGSSATGVELPPMGKEGE